MSAGLKVLILGASGAAGGSLFDVCLASPFVSEVRTISRRPIAAAGSAKHREFLLPDLDDLAPVSAAFADIDTAFYCIGRAVSLVPREGEYRRLTLELPLAVAARVRALSPAATFHYLSGQRASPTSKARWARTKGEAEVALMRNYQAVCWRPGVIDAKNNAGWPWFYRLVIPAVRLLAPSRRLYVSGTDLGKAMVSAAATGLRSCVIENPEIRALADGA